MHTDLSLPLCLFNYTQVFTHRIALNIHLLLKMRSEHRNAQGIDCLATDITIQGWSLASPSMPIMGSILQAVMMSGGIENEPYC